MRELDSLFKNIKVISFNYDRTLELFLFEKIKTLYSVSSNTAAKIAQQLEIVRPYGWLGPLPIVHESPDCVAFGDISETVETSKLSRNIRTFSEILDSETEQKISETVRRAKLLLFLGFGYHKQNMALLSGSRTDRVQVYGTTIGIASPNKAAISSRINSSFLHPKHQHSMTANDAPILVDSECGQFMRDHKELFKA